MCPYICGHASTLNVTRTIGQLHVVRHTCVVRKVSDVAHHAHTEHTPPGMRGAWFGAGLPNVRWNHCISWRKNESVCVLSLSRPAGSIDTRAVCVRGHRLGGLD